MSVHSSFRTSVALAAMLLSLPVAAAQATPDETPQAFVRRVYARYGTSDSAGVERGRPAGAPFYADALLDAFAKDEALLHGEIGVIDADPICACQAWEHLRIDGLTLAKVDAGAVKARVALGNFTRPQRVHVVVVLTLSHTPSGWRIADVGDKDRPSLLAALRSEIGEIEHAPAPAVAAPAPKP